MFPQPVRFMSRLQLSSGIARSSIALLAAVLAAVSFAALTAGAQSLQRPEGWRVHLDGAPHDTIYHVRMPPGWHMTTPKSSGAILYDPAHRAEGRFVIESEIFLFPGTSQSGYGLFVGGRDLDGASPSYVSLLIRRDGAMALEQVSRSSRTMLVPWTKSQAVTPHPGGDDTSRNVIRLSVERDSVVLESNATRVASIARGDIPLDGTFGFRVGPDVNLHVSTLNHTMRLAPVPAPKRAP